MRGSLVESLVKTPVSTCRMSFTVTLPPAAADVEAPLTEWSEKIEIES